MIAVKAGRVAGEELVDGDPAAETAGAPESAVTDGS
jgi:hypothetical protein